jgi:imidazolonepropionase-like amidohydrolase
MLMRLRILMILAVGIQLLAQPRGESAGDQAGAERPRQLALVGGDIYTSPTENPIRKGIVLIEGGRIAAVGPAEAVQVPKGIPTLNCAGLTVMAGFWNSHVHFMERKWADAEQIPAAELDAQLQGMLTRFGFTSVWDTGSPWSTTRVIRKRIESGEVHGPRIRSTGEPLFPKGSFPVAQRTEQGASADALGFVKYDPIEIADATDATAAAKRHLDEGTDGVKLYAAIYFPPFTAMSQPAIEAAVKEAHARGKPAFAHPTTRAGLLAAVNGGVDVILHTTPEAGPWDETVLGPMRQARVALVPTLKLFGYERRHDRVSGIEQATAVAVGQLRKWMAAGGVILFGTDVGYMSEYDPRDEYKLMADAGMSVQQILASLTTAPAERFMESKRLGRIAPGLAGDLVVLNRDPAGDIRAFADVRYTIRDGIVIHGL